MAYTLYDATLPALTRGLNNLSAILKKAEGFARETGMDPSELLSAKLADDMFPLSRQVQIVSDTAKSAAGRLAQIDMPSWPDTETTFDQLQQRIATTQAYLGGVTAEQVNGAEDRTITLPMPGTELKLPGRMFAAGFVLPNFYFHITTAYAILRHKGVPLGKMDFLGGA